MTGCYGTCMSMPMEEDLRSLVERALALADAQGLTEVAIALDRARVSLSDEDGRRPVTDEEIDRLLGTAA